MKNFIIVLLISFNLTVLSLGLPKTNHDPYVAKIVQAAQLTIVDSHLLKRMDEVSVNIITDKGIGSGTILIEKVGDKVYRFILTSGHVVDGADPESIRIIQNQEQDGVLYGKWHSTAKVVKVTKQGDYDIAILAVVTETFKPTVKVTFSPNKYAKNGDRICHVGSSLGYQNSFLFGHVSRIGRYLTVEEKSQLYDQIQVGAYKGSSGGGVFSEKGEFLGIYSRVLSENIGFMTPLRQIKEWAARDGFTWIFDETTPPKEVLDIFPQ